MERHQAVDELPCLVWARLVDLAAACDDFLGVGRGLLEDVVQRREGYDWRHLVDQGDGTVLEFAGGIALGVDVGQFLELEGAFEGNGITGAATEIEHVPGAGDDLCQALDLRLAPEDFGDVPGDLDQRIHQAALGLFVDGSPGVGPDGLEHAGDVGGCAVVVAGQRRCGNHS